MNRYPLWRYILLFGLIVLGLLYATPNLFGDDPAIQIQTKDSASVNQELGEKIVASLTAQGITYASIKRQPYSFLLRFKDAEEQLKAQDILQTVLGPDYVVALNLAPRTPPWLLALGAEPMKLGLDLRGGIHFLLEVNVDEMLKERLTSDTHTMGEDLRQAQIRYTGLSQQQNDQIVLHFNSEELRDTARNLLSKKYSDYQFNATAGVGDDYTITARMLKSSIANLEQYAVGQNLLTLRNKVNELGVAEPVIQQQGKNQISVDLPGVQDSARAKEIMGKVATIRLQLEDTEHDAAAAARTGIIPFGSSLYMFEGHPILVKNQVILHGRSILSASSSTDQNGRPAVSIRAGGSEVALFNRITRENVGKPLATLYVETKSIKKIVDGKVVIENPQVVKVINKAIINEALANMFEINGLETQRYANDLALQLRSGAYSAPLNFVQERLVGPSLGKENIHKGVLSTEVGAILIMVFMAFYYRLFGLVADLALLLDIVFVVAIMSVLGATLTLPGIAGIVLTVGMAVDANVLINERIREELRNGMSAQAAIQAGYDRAFSTIIDSNVSTLIVTAILFALGTGPVQGFAVTLAIGLLTSMVTAIFFTRAIINLIYGGRRHTKSLSIGIKLREFEKIKAVGVRGGGR